MKFFPGPLLNLEHRITVEVIIININVLLKNVNESLLLNKLLEIRQFLTKICDTLKKHVFWVVKLPSKI